eukprot:COSAG04_NODE_92_length_26689_cov_12.755434_18_plen_453_part_00
MERASASPRRRLAVVSAHLAAAAAANGPWRPGQRFRLTEDRKLLARLCVRENVHRIDAAGSYRIVRNLRAGTTGEIKQLERGNPVAYALLDGTESLVAIPLAAALRTTADDVRLASRPLHEGEEAGDADALAALPSDDVQDGEAEDLGLDDDDDDDDDDALVAQMENLALEDELAVVVYEALLPGQTLTFVLRDADHPALVARAWDGQSFGMVGMSSGLPTDALDPRALLGTPTARRVLFTGVECEVVKSERVRGSSGQLEEGGRRQQARWNQQQQRGSNRPRLEGSTGGPGLQVTVRAARQFELSDGWHGSWDEDGATIARVRWVADEDRPGAEALPEFLSDLQETEGRAELLLVLLEQWLKLARDGGHERRDGQLDGILRRLGPTPPPTRPSALAMFAGALVNPMPGLGVAKEVRASLLKAVTAAERLELVTAALRDSIKRLRFADPKDA